ncbi:MAG: hypothetical protein M3464_05620 [Chloroflexota bacterium]|nr:hypothetical protein [Chloroflexota bacterium]
MLERSFGRVTAHGTRVLAPRDAFFTPGEVITAEKIAYLQAGAAHGMHLSDPADPAPRTPRVVAR